MKSHCFRLKYGEDILLEIKNYLEINNIKSAVILSAVGCVTKAKIRDASGITIKERKENMEIVSIMGTLSKNRCHLHISFSREDLSTIGGHLVEGCLVNTTAEIVILELNNFEFSSKFDEKTGYDELLINKI
jgi:hypothetical protein